MSLGMRSHEIEHRIFRVHSTGVLRCDVLEIEPTGYHQTSSTLRVRESRDREIVREMIYVIAL